MGKRLTKEEFQGKVDSAHGEGSYTVLGEYKNSKTKILVRHNCEECNNHEWYPMPSNLIAKHGCPICGSKKGGNSTRYTLDKVKEEVYKLVGDEFTIVSDEYQNCDTLLTFRHNTDEPYLFETSWDNFKQGSRGKKERYRKMKATNLERYGAESVLQVPEIRQKGRDTYFAKTGYESPMLNPEVKDKIKQGFVQKYGVENPMQNPETRQKVKDTLWKDISPEQKLFKEANTLREALINLNTTLDRKPTVEEIVSASGYIKPGSLYRNGLSDHRDLYILGGTTSKAEEEIAARLSEYVEIVQNNRSLLGNGQEIDIYVPSAKVGIEYCGMYWHSSNSTAANGHFKPKDYHYNKFIAAKEHGIHLIQIFEDEYAANPDLIISKLLHYCGVNTNTDSIRIHARKCNIKEIEAAEAKDFLNANHTQGFAGATMRLGAFFEDELIAVMQFGKNFRSADSGYELNRFATNVKYRIPGIFSKMLKDAARRYDIKRFYSFADMRWVNPENNVYKNNGWVLESTSKQDYSYYDNQKKIRIHKASLQKKEIAKKYPEYYDETLTEIQMTDQIPNMLRIYDAGKQKYTYEIKEIE